MIITDNQLKQILSHNPDYASWLDLLNSSLTRNNIDTTNRIAAIFAQAAHESAEFTRLHESLNYGAAGLLATWPARFTPETANQYARQQEKIGNKVYANRMGNGDEASGDGWKFKGRGIFQLTGRNNYQVCSMDLYGDDRLLINPELVETPDVALETACWFWNKNQLNTFADSSDIKGMTKIINGGYIGLEDRLARYNSALNVFGA